MRAETDPHVAAEFWAESHRKAKRQNEIAAMSRPLERANAILADAWLSGPLVRELNSTRTIFGRNRGNDLDVWLSEEATDGRMPQVRAALLP